MILGEGERVPITHDTELWCPEVPEFGNLGRQYHELTAELCRLVTASEWLGCVLEASRSVLTTPWCVAAGAIRSLVWDHLHGRPARPPVEIDLVHFSPLAPLDADAALASSLTRRLPQFRWDVVNQVYAHRFAVNPRATPFVSLEHAMACWPETATAVGISMDGAGQLRVVAPLGLTDLFDLVLRRSPWLRDPELFEQRLAEKRFCERWPRLRVV